MTTATKEIKPKYSCREVNDTEGGKQWMVECDGEREVARSSDEFDASYVTAALNHYDPPDGKPMKLVVKRIADDGHNRPRLKNVVTGAIYADISLGAAGEKWNDYKERKGIEYEFNLSGDWHTVSQDGEPSSRLRKEVVFIVME